MGTSICCSMMICRILFLTILCLIGTWHLVWSCGPDFFNVTMLLCLFLVLETCMCFVYFSLCLSRSLSLSLSLSLLKAALGCSFPPQAAPLLAQLEQNTMAELSQSFGKRTQSAVGSLHVAGAYSTEAQNGWMVEARTGSNSHWRVSLWALIASTPSYLAMSDYVLFKHAQLERNVRLLYAPSALLTVHLSGIVDTRRDVLTPSP